MIKKTVFYTDFNGEKTTEDLYFHLSKAELLNMEITKDGSFSKYLIDISQSNNAKDVLEIMKELILSAYGERSEDGKRFHKSKANSDAFATSEAFSELLFGLLADADEASAFFLGLLPDDVRERAKGVSPDDLPKIQAAIRNDAVGKAPSKEEWENLSNEELIKRLTGN